MSDGLKAHKAQLRFNIAEHQRRENELVRELEAVRGDLENLRNEEEQLSKFLNETSLKEES